VIFLFETLNIYKQVFKDGKIMKETATTTNVFTETLKKNPEIVQELHIWTNGKRKKGLLRGTLRNLVTPILAKVDLPLKNPDWEYIRSCFIAQRPGFVTELSRGIYVVNKKAFTKWVKNNVRRIFMKKKKDKPVEINKLPKERKKKVRKIKGKLKRGTYNVITRTNEDKTVSGVLRAIG
jgi:hypothetical protein